jgi:hypothetical protein
MGNKKAGISQLFMVSSVDLLRYFLRHVALIPPDELFELSVLLTKTIGAKSMGKICVNRFQINRCFVPISLRVTKLVANCASTD